MDNSCKDCTHRELKCHATCEDYIKWKTAWDKVKKKENAYRHLQGELTNRRNVAIKKMRRN